MIKRILLLTIALILSLVLVSCSSNENVNGHVFLDAKDKGDNKILCGNVLFAVFFANDSDSSWSENEKNSSQRFYRMEADSLIEEAQKYGANLTVDMVCFDCVANAPLSLFNNSDWIDQALDSAGLPPKNQTIGFLKDHYKKEEVVIIFAVKRKGRSFALPTNENEGFECAFIYNNVALRHEVLHLFGAKDLYYPQSIKTIAKDFLGESIMLDSSIKSVDDFTAYLIGWSPTPTDVAQSFIDKTSTVSQEEINNATEKETLTGNSQQTSDVGIYEGDLVDGVKHGKGTFYFNYGDVYIGDFKNGNMEGMGTYIWHDGSLYTGEFVNGKPFGQGTRIMVNGDVYKGSFVNGEMTGKGTLTFENGTEYTGDFLLGYRTGKGTITYPDGTTYTGDFVRGSYHGYGTLTNADGTVQSGYFDHHKYFGIDENTPWYYINQ